MKLIDYINKDNRGFFCGSFGANGLYLIDSTFYEVYNSPEKQLEMSLKLNETYNGDFAYILDDGQIFCETLGLELLKPDYDFPSVLNHPIQSIKDLEKYTVPDPYTSGRMPLNLKSAKLVVENIDKPQGMSLQGPFTLAIQLAGATQLLRSIINNKEFVERILDFTTETVLRYAKAMEKVGVQYISIAEPASVTLSPTHFKQYVVSNLNKIYDELNCWKALHICGNTMDFLPLMLECNLDALSLDQIMDYRKVINLIPEDIVLAGNIDPVERLSEGTKDEVRYEVLSLLKSMRNHRNHMVDFGCTCYNGTPIEVLQTLVETAQTPYSQLDNIKL
mgnify:CR=1 FL=1